MWFTDLDIGEEIQTNEGKTQPVETIVMKSPFETLRIAKGAKLSLVPAVSPTQTTSLHIEPANLVLMQALDLRSQIRSVRSWLALTNFFESLINLAERTSLLCPVKV